MKYLCLAYEEEKVLSDLTPDEWAALRIETLTREQLGGFFLIEARDMNAAIQIAAKWPSARLGSIEVRPVEEELRTEKRYA